MAEIHTPAIRTVYRYISGDPAHDYDLVGAALAALDDAERDGIETVRRQLKDFRRILEPFTLNLSETEAEEAATSVAASIKAEQKSREIRATSEF